MSGLLRRIKRSRAADAGEAPAEGQAAAPEDARTTTETAAAAARAGKPLAGASESRPGAARSARPTTVGAAQSGAGSSRSGRPAKAAPPAILADPELPAGVDPAEAAVQPPKGRRGRLRRRLRYLRRARELMLRDLGGLLYEVHRTGGGDLSAHGTVIGAKVQRLASLDAETGAIETALASPRGEAVVFQPGVGGTCVACGELYGSAACFCSNCGAPTGADVRTTPATGAEPARPVPPMPKAPEEADTEVEARADAATGVEAAETEVEAPADAPTRVEGTGDEPTRGETPANAPSQADRAASEPSGDAPTRVDEPADAPSQTDATADDATPGGPGPGHPFTSRDNGRAQDSPGPDRSQGDPLARESRS